jgi:hypothetical protein
MFVCCYFNNNNNKFRSCERASRSVFLPSFLPKTRYAAPMREATVEASEYLPQTVFFVIVQKLGINRIKLQSSKV